MVINHVFKCESPHVWRSLVNNGRHGSSYPNTAAVSDWIGGLMKLALEKIGDIIKTALILKRMKFK